MLSATRRLLFRPLTSINVYTNVLRTCFTSPTLPDRPQPPPEVLNLLIQEEEKQLGMEAKKKKKKGNRIKLDPFEHTNRPVAVIDPGYKTAVRRVGFQMKSKKLKLVDPPEFVTNTLDRLLLGEFQEIGNRMDQYLAAGVSFRRFVANRRFPSEGRLLKATWDTIEAEIRKQYETKRLNALEEGSLHSELDVETTVQKETRKVFDRKAGGSQWVPVEYDDNAAWVYLLGKAAFDYAVVKTILDEIKQRTAAENWQPRTLFDFGSGVGTCVWAMKETFGEMTEYLSVDDSRSMNELMKTVLLKGKSKDPMPAGYFNRINLPMDSSSLKYDVVTAAFSLLDLPSERDRLGLIEELWKRTEDFLVLTEVGTNAGFHAIAEARHFLNQLSKEDGHLFSPCPHQHACPRYEQDTIPCNFDVRYRNFPLATITPAVRSLTLVDRYSYVVFRKGECKEKIWPRLVAQPIRDKSHVVCKLCTKEGSLQETLFRKASQTPEEKILYKYAKRVHTGQQFKVALRYPDTEEGKKDKPDDDASEVEPSVES